MDFSLQPNLNLSPVKDLPGVQARAAFIVNSAAVFKEDYCLTAYRYGPPTVSLWGYFVGG